MTRTERTESLHIKKLRPNKCNICGGKVEYIQNKQRENKVYGWQDEVFTELDDTPDDMPWT